MPMLAGLRSRAFAWVHRHQLIYNACWEDPRLDRAALELGPDDVVLVITSAGCNALDYALDGPRAVYAVDLNPRQNALLELKQAALRRLDYERFFAMFGRGRLPHWQRTYAQELRGELSPAARRYWDRRIEFFAGLRRGRSFYFRGASGAFARMINGYIDRVARVRDDVRAILAARSTTEQRKIYDERLRDRFWRPFLRWCLRRDAALALLGVPPAQRDHLERTHPGGLLQFVEQAIEAVFADLPLADNYFWRAYLEGGYAPDCCPRYLEPDGFERLRAGLVDRVVTHTMSVTEFLARRPQRITRFVLLDHMDWLTTVDSRRLAEEWQQIVARAAPDARLLWRSGGTETAFVDEVVLHRRGERVRVGELLQYDRELAARLHPLDRVHTYGSFHIARLAA